MGSDVKLKGEIVEPYNGYKGTERQKKYDVYKKLQAQGLSVPADTPCQLCGDDDKELHIEPHSEDYSKPYKWTPPAEYMVCRRCHGWIHKRFAKPDDWTDFKAHVKRGGYAWEFTSREGATERRAAAEARKNGSTFKWEPIKGRVVRSGDLWWEGLTTDPYSKTAKWARPRP